MKNLQKIEMLPQQLTEIKYGNIVKLLKLKVK